jgi:branched-chain amino acid transport system permease protein
MAADANARPAIAVERRPIETFFGPVFGPIVQVLLYIVGSAVFLGLFVILVALAMRGSRPELLGQTINLLPQVIIDGIVRGFLFATIALGYTMVYGVLEFINFAHGEIFMVGAFTGAAFGLVLAATGTLEFFAPRPEWGAVFGFFPPLAYIVTNIPPFTFTFIALVLGMTISGLLAMGTERVAYRPLRNAPRLVALISAIGMSLFLQDAVRMIATSTPFLSFNTRFVTPDRVEPFRIELPFLVVNERIVAFVITNRALTFIIVALLILMLLNYLVNVTRLGRAIRAVAQDRATASLMGINVNQIIAITFLIGGALGGAAGVLLGASIGTVNPYMGFLPGLKAFTAAVLGGIGNITGAMVGGIVLGFLEAFVASYLTIFTGGVLSGASYADIAAFSILIFILIFRPTGLLGESTTQKV